MTQLSNCYVRGQRPSPQIPSVILTVTDNINGLIMAVLAPQPKAQFFDASVLRWLAVKSLPMQPVR